MPFERLSGVLVHPTSLPGPFGIGDMGPAAYRFVDFLVRSGQRWWQILPLGPTGFGNSPYACFSAIAGNPLLISPELLAEEGWLSANEWRTAPEWEAIQEGFSGLVDYSSVIRFKRHVIKTAFENFKQGGTAEQKQDFAQFCQEESEWLEDYSLFAVLLAENGGKSWTEWEDVDGGSVSLREEGAIATAKRLYSEQVEYRKFVEFVFLRHWLKLKEYANERGVQLVGDIPIYVAFNSADVWANPELYFLDEEGKPEEVAGVPPDYFSATGQLWGNPIYRWDLMAERGYDWWLMRFKKLLRQVDVVRIDHFRAFEAYWSVPGDEETAMNGKWIPGPGAEFFEVVRDKLGELPIIAEDLGVITPEVEALRDQFEFPGMRILQFAFGGDPGNPYLPINYPRNCVVYTGTHDNDTMVGWFYGEHMQSQRGEGIRPNEKDTIFRYLGIKSETDIPEEGIHWSLVRLAMASVADSAVTPLQDLLGLERDSRMNFPSTVVDNWQWRFTEEMLTDDLVAKLLDMTLIYRRIPGDYHAKRMHELEHPKDSPLHADKTTQPKT